MTPITQSADRQGIALTGTDIESPAFGESLHQAMYPIFDGRPIFVSDSYEVLSWLTRCGCMGVPYDKLGALSPEDRANVAIIPTTVDQLPRYDQWHNHFADSRVLILSFESFDPSIEAIKYSMATLARTSVEAAVEHNNAVVSMLMNLDHEMTIAGAGSELTCRLEDDVTVLRPKVENDLAPGEWESLGAYFEVGMVPTPEDFKTGIRPGFIVNGELNVPGVAVAHHRHVPAAIRAQSDAAWQLLSDVRRNGGFPLRVTVENSIVREVASTDRDLLPALTELTNPHLDGVLTEMSFSTNAALSPDTIDWRYNSQLNEGALGIHVALGDGTTGAHVDFIAPGCLWESA